MNSARAGAGYFLSQQGRLSFTPEDYIEFRALKREDSNKLLQEWALKVEGGFLCSAVGCTTVHKRRVTLKNHFQRAHSVSRERVTCPEPGCRRSFGLLPELKRHRAAVHGNGARYCPCLKRWFTRRGHLVDRCPNRENCSAAIDRRRKSSS